MSLRALGYLLVQLYVWVLLGRFLVDWVMQFNQNWRPRGIVLALVDLAFRLTDPPLRALRRWIPPLRLGGVAIDLSFLLLLFGIQAFAPYLLRLLP